MGVPLACLWRAFGVPTACHGHVLVENCISTRSAHFSTVFFHTCLKLRNRQSGQAVFAWGRDFHTLFHTLWKTGFCGFVAGCRTGVWYDIFCDFCIIGLVCLFGYLVNRVGLWGGQGGGRLPTLPCRNPAGGLLSLSPASPAFSFLFCPHPPDPPSPPGKGETKGYFMQGASPLASPGLNPGGIGFSCGKRVPAGLRLLRGGVGVALRCPEGGARGGGRPPTLPCRNPAGGLPFWSPACPFTLALILPPSPRPPSPPGKGET